MKKFLSFILCLILLVTGMVACDIPSDTTQTEATTTSASTPASDEQTTEQTTTAASTTASAKKDITLNIATFNIHNGADVNYEYPVLANDLKLHKLDIVGLQEVDMNTERNGKQDTMKILSERTGMAHYVFAPAMDYKGGEYGIAVLSKYPILSHEVVNLPLADGETEPRIMLHTVIDVEGYHLDFFVAHGSQKRAQDQLIKASEYTSKCDAFIYLGDYNTRHFEYFDVFKNAYTVNNADNYIITTVSGDAPFDNIVLSDIFIAKNVTAVNTGHSDHKMLKAEVTIPLPQPKS